jgi:hypothetical protein
VNTVQVTSSLPALGGLALVVEGALPPPVHGAPQPFVEVEAEATDALAEREAAEDREEDGERFMEEKL